MSELKTIIDANIKENGNQEITGKTLNYVLNRIAEGTEKDWNESDATKGGYIKGRTHGVTYELVSVEGTLKELGYVPGEYISVLHYARVNGVLEGKGLYLGGLLYNPIVGEEYIVKYAGPSVYAKVVEVEDGYDVQIKGASDTGNILKVAIVGYKTIDDAYISTDIARKSQVDALEDKVDNLPQGDQFDKEGNYPLLHVGTADDLAGRGESVPAEFGFRASGGKSIKDGRAYIKRIKGNSVVWNQTMEKPYTTFFKNRVTYSIENNVVRCVVNSIAYPFVGIYSNKVEKQHTYLVAFKYLGNKNAYVEGGIEIQGQGINIAANKLTQFTAIKKASETASVGFVVSTTIESMEIGDTFEIHDINVYDLTKMFGAGNEPSTIEEFNARVATLGVDMNAYNEGQVIHCNTESIKSVGDNAWDEEWITGYYMGKEYISVATNQICSANPIPCLPNEAYCVSLTGKTSFPNTIKFTFLDAQGDSIGEVKITNTDQKITTPINATSFLVSFGVDYGDTYKNDILISLYHSGWKAQKDDQYQPYWQDTLPLPIIRKYFPDGMKSAGSAHDEIRYNKASGKWEKVVRIGSVDLGTFDYILDSRFDNAQFYCNTSLINTNIRCGRYVTIEGGWDTNKDKTITRTSGGHILIVDSAYTDVASFKAAMQGVILYYEAAEWEWVELDAEDQNFRDYYNVADFGTEQAISSIPSAPFSADIIYQFNAVDMIREHELEITELQSIIATMQAQLTSLINGGQ